MSVLVTRRAFLQGLGLGAAGLGLGLFPARALAAAPATTAATGLRPNVFVHLASDGTLTVVCARSEMGQGVRSSLPFLIADEMGADLGRVKVVQGDGNPAYGDQDTDGSSSVRKPFDDLRRAGATARAMLIAAAAQRWHVAPATCEARDHFVVHAASKRKLAFGDLAEAAAKLPVPAEKDVTLRPLSQLRHLGTDLPFVDGKDIVTGHAQFGADVRLPGMLTAVVARPPVVGGRVAHVDTTAAEKVPGVRKVLTLPAPTLPFKFQPLGGVAVIADNTWAALRGREALKITWDDGPNAVYDSDRYKDELLASVSKPGKPMREVGHAEAELGKATRKVEAVYHTPHLAHAPMEPPAAVVRLDGDKAEVWAPTQGPDDVAEEVAHALGLDKKNVTVHVTLLGGAFGRKAKPDYCVEAALCAKAAGAPVRVQWTREDDIRHNYYHSTSTQRFAAALDDGGKVTAWHHRSAFPPIGSTFSGATFGSLGDMNQGVLDLPLAIPNLRVEVCEAKAHVRIGWMRSVANIYHAFAVHSFIDELAHARGLDPRANLLEIIGPGKTLSLDDLGVKKLPNYGQSTEQHPVDTRRLRNVVERVTAASRWEQRQKEGRALGLAAHRSFLTYVAVVVSLGRDARGRLRADEAWICADAGTIVNRERVQAQMEGAVVFGLSLGLYGAITMKHGATVEGNFRDYRLLRIAEAPRIHVDIVRSEAPPGGVGEPGVPPVAPALANAYFALTGERIRELPLVPLPRG